MTGTLINVGTVLAGGLLGSLIGARFPDRIRRTLMQAIGLITLVIGLQRALPTENVLVLLISLALGTVVGELLNIEAGLEQLGNLAQRMVARPHLNPFPDGEAAISALPQSSVLSPQSSSDVVRAFVTASLLFYVGPMTVLGSFEDGLNGAYQTLAIKAALDGVSATVLASSLGWGVLLSSLTVLTFQGALALSAGLLRGLLTDPMIREMTAVGGVLIIGIGLNILDLARVRVGNMLPALVVAPLLVAFSVERG